MPAVLVHGVPDTSEVWQDVLDELDREDVVALALPGFGTSLPAGFEPTKESYAAWIVERLEEMGEPVDLVGHDWGSNFVQYIGSGHAALIRTWAAGGGVVDVDYVWHDLAQAWQTPEVGEQVMEAMSGDALAPGLAEAGRPHADAAASKIDDTMKQCILTLYRSAVDLGAEWQPTVERNERPALVIWGTNDPYCSDDPYAQRLADRTHSEVRLVEGGHWAMFERPAETARILEEFWSEAR